MCAIKSLSRLCLALAALIIFPAGLTAQEVSYTIAGDVPSPGTYSHPAGEPMDLAQLLEKGGVSGEQGIAAILRRPNLQTISTNSIRPGEQPNRTPVGAGDVVVFRRYEPHGVFERHAVLISGGEPRIVPLTGATRSLGQAMAAEGLQYSQPTDIIRVTWGSTDRLSLSGNAELLHGDIVNVANAGPMSGLRITETFAQPAVPVVHTSLAEVGPSNSGLSRVPSASSSLIVPPNPQPTTLHIPAAESEPTVVEFGGNEQMELRVPDSSQTSENPTPFRTASLESHFTDAEISQPGDSIETSTADSSGSGVLNAVFVVGLLFAIGLIGLGWLKTQHEHRMEVEMAQSLQNSTTRIAGEPKNEVADLSDEADVPLTEAAAPPISKTVSDDCPVLLAGIQDETMDSELSSIEHSSREEMQTLSSISRTAAAESDVLATDDSTWFDSDSFSANAELPPEADSQAETKDSSVVKSDLLEDLLQNRLPMELKQAQLPLQVALFGKPSGPQRIRIDAAHTTIAAPHMASSANRAKRKTPVAAAKKTNESRHNQQQRSDSGQSAMDGSRFDRALNFLEEQSEK